MSVEKFLTRSLEESLACKRSFWDTEKESFFRAGETLGDAIRSKSKVLVFGNGGSACDAMHFAGEWVNRFSVDREPLACLALGTDAPLLTCIANDYDFSRIFDRQVSALGRPGDVAVGISTSGNSPNVIKGLEAARVAGMKRIALLGGDGGTIASKGLAEILLVARGSKHTPRVQETHEWILHSLCDYVEIEVLRIRST